MTELRHLQLVIMQIMKDIDDICRRNNIDYYLNGGSAIGAIRHKGFIPWDDDLDIMMTFDNYERFIKACREQLDPEKYYVQEGLKDWPLNYTKIKLIGTCFDEREAYVKDERQRGIFVDVFKMDNTSSNRLLQFWQYACAKYRVCYLMSKRTYKSAGWKKKLFMASAFPQNIGFIRRFFEWQSELYNGKNTVYIASFYESKRFKKCIFRREVFGTPKRVEFEGTMLPVPAEYDSYLTTTFGNYMQLPPEEERKLKHLTKIDFGKY